MRLEAAVMKMGVIPNWTCTPYYGFTAPRMGEHLAWSESSAVAYANTRLRSQNQQADSHR